MTEDMRTYTVSIRYREKSAFLLPAFLKLAALNLETGVITNDLGDADIITGNQRDRITGVLCRDLELLDPGDVPHGKQGDEEDKDLVCHALDVTLLDIKEYASALTYGDPVPPLHAALDADQVREVLSMVGDYFDDDIRERIAYAIKSAIVGCLQEHYPSQLSNDVLENGLPPR